MFSFVFRKQWSNETRRIVNLMPENGVFLTGIEGSDPHVDGVRRNQLLEAHDFYTNYATRLENIRNLGITWLRFGPPYSQAHPAKDRYDFTFIDKVLSKCDGLGISVMADLLHFGLPDWMHESRAHEPYFQNPDFPEEFAKYVTTFVKRYPYIHYFTVINEPFVTAYFSAKLGIWNERHRTQWDDDRQFVKATTNIARAAILGRQAIEAVWQEEQRTQELIFVQNESFEAAVAAPGSGREKEAERFNLRRFAPLDLILGHRNEAMRRYFLNHGVSAQDYEWFMTHGKSDKTILGIDHYPGCIHTYEKDGTIDHGIDKPYQLYNLTKLYWNRYPLPLLHTEVNGRTEYAVTICKKTYDSLCQLKREGYPVLGMGWYGDELQIGWQNLMAGPSGYEEYPVGLFYKGVPQPVSVLFKQMLEKGIVTEPVSTQSSLQSEPAPALSATQR